MNTKNLRIGILTFHKSINYGSVLQAYALSKTLKDAGYSVEIIDYEPQRYEEIYSLYLKNNSLHHVLSNVLKRFPYRVAYKNRVNAFKNFRQTYLPLSKEKYYFDSDLEVLNDRYDVLIVGSDQVWNVFAYDCDDAYFLPISHKAKKIAYAVSINNATFTERRCDDRLRSLIMDFDAVSSREKSGCQRLSGFLNGSKEIINTLDPTLLADPKVFESIKSARIVKEPYIFLYSISFSDDVIASARSLSQRTGMPVYTLMTSLKSYNFLQHNSDKIYILKNHLSPEDFLSFISNAEYVVTNSFHGTAFSLLFEKQFYSICPNKVDGTKKYDERLYSILTHLGIEDRLISMDEVNISDLSKKIDYNNVNTKKEDLVANSRKFLYDAIEV